MYVNKNVKRWYKVTRQITKSHSVTNEIRDEMTDHSLSKIMDVTYLKYLTHY